MAIYQKVLGCILQSIVGKHKPPDQVIIVIGYMKGVGHGGDKFHLLAGNRFLFGLDEFQKLKEHNDLLGLGQFFVDIAAVIAGRYTGGLAKVSVVSSAFFGTISGSSIANTVSTGSLTIPNMKRMGYPASFSGGVESASSVGGAIMPPVMSTVTLPAPVKAPGRRRMNVMRTNKMDLCRWNFFKIPRTT